MAINYLELIDGMKFPATRAEIVEWAIEHDASEEALDAFRAMPQQHFPTLTHVGRAVGLLDRLPGDLDVTSQQRD